MMTGGEEGPGDGEPEIVGACEAESVSESRPSSFIAESVLDPVVLAEVTQVPERRAQNADQARDLTAVVLHFRIAICQAVDGFVLFEAVFLERETLDQVVQLRAQDEGDVAHAQEPAALRAMHFLGAGVGHAIDHELPLTARALENFRDHAPSLRPVFDARERSGNGEPRAVSDIVRQRPAAAETGAPWPNPLRTRAFRALRVCTALAMAVVMSADDEEKKEIDMPASRRQTESEPERREPAEPPPYWWRRAEDNRQGMTLSLLLDEPEVLDAGDLVEDEDETLPKGKLPLSADLP
jgi:hypothetical protein